MSRKKNKKTRNQRTKAEQQAKAAERRKDRAAEQKAVEQIVANTASDLAKSGTFLDDLRKEKAAQLIAQNDLSIVDVAAAVGVHRETIRVWQLEPTFAERVAEHAKLLADLSRQFLIARRAYRLGNLQERLLRMQRLLDARAGDPDVQKARGGDTGLLVRRLRMIGSGENAQVVEEFEFDAALDRAMRDTERQAAQECGQWTEKKEVSGAGGGPLLLQIIEEVTDDSSGTTAEPGGAGAPASGPEAIPTE